MKNKKTLLALLFVIFFSASSIKFAMSMSSAPEEEVSEAELPHHKQQNLHYVKPHAGISLKQPAIKRLRVGEQKSLDLVFKLSETADRVVFKIRAGDDSIRLLSEPDYEVNVVNKKLLLPLAFEAHREGQVFIEIYTVIIKGNNQQGRSFLIPVQIGDIQQQKSTDRAAKNASHYKEYATEGVISSPALETVE